MPDKPKARKEPEDLPEPPKKPVKTGVETAQENYDAAVAKYNEAAAEIRATSTLLTQAQRAK